MAASRKRKFFIRLGVLLGLIGIFVCALPLWFPWILPRVARHYGLHYAGYERYGYSRLILRNASYTNCNVHFQAGSVKTFVPSSYLWNRYVGRGATFLQVSNWVLEVRPTGSSGKPRKPVYSQFQTIETNLARVLAFVPKAVLTNGLIEAYGQKVFVPSAIVSTSLVSADFVFPEYEQSGAVVANLKAGPPYMVRLDSESLKLHATISVSQDPSILRFDATGVWLTNRFEAGVQFSPGAFLPDRAYAEAKAFDIPAQIFKLPQFTDFHGSLSGEWLTNRFAVNIAGLAAARVPQHLPPLTLDLRAIGDTNSVFLEQAKISAPWLYAELSEKTRVQFTPPFLQNPAALKVFLDLNRQPWFAARGEVRGEATVLPAEAKLPSARFSLSGSGIQISNIQTKSLSVTGAVHWPWLELPKATAAFPDGSLLSGRARLNLQKKEVEDGFVSFSGRFGQQWLAGYVYTNAAMSAQFSGPLTNLSHAGQVKVQELARAGLTTVHPLNVTGDWKGRQLTLNDFEARISAGNSILALQGSANLAKPGKSVRLSQVDLQKSGQTLLGLQQALEVSLQRVLQNQKLTWRVALSPMDLSGSGGKVHLAGKVDWPQSGDLGGTITGLNLEDFSDFIRLPAQRFSLADVNFAANWANGPLNFRLTLAGAGLLPDNRPLEAQASVSGSAQGISVQSLSIATGSNLLAKGQGTLPITIYPAQLAFQFLPDAPLRLDAQSEPGAFFWTELARIIGITLENPHIKIEAGGTWKAPQGTIEFQAARAQFSKSKQAVPDLEHVKATIRINRESAQVDPLTLLVAKQAVTLTGQVPLGQKFWLSLPHKPQAPDWSQASAHLKIAQAQIAALAPVLPKFLYPQGVLKADLGLLPGGNLDGQLSLTGAATAPLPNLGPVSGLDLAAQFEKRTMNLKAGGTMGGGTISANGTVDLQGTAQALLASWQSGSLPPFKLQLLGTNISLVRQPELILRADLDGAISQTGQEPVLLSGTVRLRDSLYLQDVGNLVGGKVAKPGSRPPYFSVSKEPFAGWRLDLKLTGSKFMRVQTPIFNGEISASLTLSGTLQDPVGLGNVTIDSGEVRFPFASLPVTQGFISLTSADPYQPHLVVNAAGQAMGYDIHLQITGPADKLVMQFTSTPALSSQQILQMLTTGELPRGTYTLSAQQRAQTFAMFVGRNVLTQFGFGSGTANRLTVRSGEEFTETGRPTYSVEYKLSPRWSVIGQYDRFNEYNLMLKWKAYSR